MGREKEIKKRKHKEAVAISDPVSRLFRFPELKKNRLTSLALASLSVLAQACVVCLRTQSRLSLASLFFVIRCRRPRLATPANSRNRYLNGLLVPVRPSSLLSHARPSSLSAHLACTHKIVKAHTHVLSSCRLDASALAPSLSSPSLSPPVFWLFVI